MSAIAGALAFFIWSGHAFAHDPGLSSANLTVRPQGLTVELTFNERDLASVAGVTVDELRSGSGAAKAKLDSIAARAALLRVGENSLTPKAASAAAEGENNLAIRYEFAVQGNGEVSFESLLLKEMAFGHRQAFAATDAGGTEISRRILSARENAVSFSLSQPGEVATASNGGRFTEFFLLGVHHIVTGYDHLLFLFGLLIVCRTRGSALLLISCFTVAHSITLALATFGLVDLPGGLVEAVIAASIVYVGIENLMGRESLMRWRWLLTLSFGLIHGLGFAGVLADLGIAKQGINAAVPLLAFNCGVEAGQLAIAAIALPLIWKLRERPSFLRVGVPACSLVIASAGAYWLLERTILS